MKPKQYKIDNFDKLINVVNDQNVEVLAKDLAGWLKWSNEMINNVRKMMPKETAGKQNSEIVKCSFVWTDDNETGMTGAIFENTDTGELKEVNFKNPIK